MFAHAQAPVRIGIAGGGTDLPVWTRERTGQCLSLAIKMYTHAVAIYRTDRQVVAAYRNRDVSSAATEIANGLMRESALMHGWEDSFEVHTLSELTSQGSGLGVSSSFAVSLAACFARLSILRDKPYRKPMGDFRNEMMRDEPVRAKPTTDGSFAWESDPEFYLKCARDAWTVEIDKLRRPIGRQDHMAAAHGGLRLYSFIDSKATVMQSFTPEDADWVAKHLLLVKLPEGHDSRAILSGVTNIKMLETAAEAVDIAIHAIQDRDLKMLGRALVKGQTSKDKIPGATPQWLKEILAKVNVETLGCKVAGAGGGGHLVVACEQGAQDLLARATQLPVFAVEPDLGGVRSEGWV